MTLSNLKHTTMSGFANLTQGAPVTDIYHPNARWFGSAPFDEREGTEAIGQVWQTLRAAFPDLERRTTILVAGENQPDPRVTGPRPATLVATMGLYLGTFRQPFCGIPATHGAAALRFCEVHAYEGDLIAQSWVLLDLPDLMRQAGVWPLAPSLGAEGLWQAPATQDGLRVETTEAEQGVASLNRVLGMHKALLSFDGKTLDSMDHGAYWTKDFLWYGTAGIGTMRGLEDFRVHHQIPFLKAFPDRHGTGHYVRIGDGPYVVTGGWPSVSGTHLGEWLGIGPTGRKIDMRVMDFYRLNGNLIAENWVPIDIIDIARQMGVDLLGRVRHRAGDPVRSL